MKRKIKISILSKLVFTSVVTLVCVISLLAVLTTYRQRGVINESAATLERTIIAGMKRQGLSELKILIKSATVSLLQSDYTTMLALIKDVGHKDDRIVAVAVLDEQGLLIGSQDESQIGKPADVVLRKGLFASTTEVFKDVKVNGKDALLFTAPIVVGKKRFGAVLAYSLDELNRALGAVRAQHTRTMTASLRQVAFVGALAVLLGVIMAVLQGYGIARPIRVLAQQTNVIAEGNFESTINIRSRDEIGDLGEKFNSMASRISMLMVESQKRLVLEQEMELARTVQQTLLPTDAVMQFDGVEVAGYFQPADKCAGDWWSYYALPDGRLLMMIADATGHGLAAAMITAVAKGAVTAYIDVAGNNVKLDELMHAMNAAIHSSAKRSVVMTCLAALHDPRTGETEICNAGHNFPLLIDSQTKKVTGIPLNGHRLGDVMPGEFGTKRLRLNPTDSLVFFTDGLIEDVNREGKQFGLVRLRRALRDLETARASELRDTVVQTALSFYDGIDLDDDITLICAKFSGAAGARNSVQA